jgi:predicted nucleotidyltransferase component of viral defense system
MKEQLIDLVRETAGPLLANNLAREYLQARILLAMQEAGAMIPLAFQGGTALRFLFDLPRFSEDLDFSLERPERGGFEIEWLAERVSAQLEREGYEVVTRRKSERTVQSLLVAFPGLLHQAGLSPHPSQRLTIRIEVDTNPPAGAGLETTIVRRHALLHLQHHDRPSLLAGKLHAILQRPWTKGRDLFDLFWYLSDRRWPDPNLVLLNQALEQTGWGGKPLDGASWPRVVADRVASLDWAAAERDVRPFLEPGPAADLFGRENLLKLIPAGRET